MDILDRQILERLQSNCRRSNAEIARELSVAPSTILERIRRLEEAGCITGYRAEIDSESIGLDVKGFVSVSLDRHDSDYIKSFEKDILGIPQVVACYHLTGRFDYLLHVTARDLEHLGVLIKQRIASIAGIGKAETFLVLSEIKHNDGWPIDKSAITESEMSDGKGSD